MYKKKPDYCDKSIFCSLLVLKNHLVDKNLIDCYPLVLESA